MKLLVVLLPLCFLLVACPPPSTFPDPPATEPDTTITTEEPDPQPDLNIGNAQVNYWIHSPLHPGNAQPVNFAIQASDSQRISRIELAIYEYELYTNDLGLPSKKRRPNGLWGMVDYWEPALPRTEITHNFTFAEGFPAHSNVEYIFTIITSNGAATRKMALFDAGDSPWPKDKILLYATTREPLGSTINLCYFPDTDYAGDWSAFLGDVESMIYQGYHQNNKIASHKEHWGFYYTQHETDGMALSQDPFNPDRYPLFMKDSLILGIDAFGLLHRQVYSDGAYLNSNIQFLAQSVFTTEGYNWGTAIHETAHAVFHLSDEYNGCVCFSSGGGSNIFKSESACTQFNDSLGFGSEACTEITAYDGNLWYLAEKPPLFATAEACKAFNIQNGLPEDSCRLFQDFTGLRSFQAFKGICIMEDDGDAQVPRFRHACGAIIDNYYQKLNPGAILPVEAILAESVDNFYGYEPVLILEVKLNGKEMAIEVKDIRYGIPTKNMVHPGDINLTLPGANGAAYHLDIDRPDCVHIHHGKNLADVQTSTKPVSCQVAVPLIKDLANIVCQDNRDGLSNEAHTFKVKQDLLNQIQNFRKK